MAFVRLVIDAERRRRALEVDELIVLARCWHDGGIGVEEAARNIQQPPNERWARWGLSMTGALVFSKLLLCGSRMTRRRQLRMKMVGW